MSQPAHQRRGPLTCLLVGLLVGPDDGAEAGEHQRAQPPRSFLCAAVVVEGVLAQHEPVAPLLDPVPPNLQQQPACKTNTRTRTASNTLKPIKHSSTHEPGLGLTAYIIKVASFFFSTAKRESEEPVVKN